MKSGGETAMFAYQLWWLPVPDTEWISRVVQAQVAWHRMLVGYHGALMRAHNVWALAGTRHLIEQLHAEKPKQLLH